MTVFNSYSTGTVTVAAGGTTVTGTGTTWSGINAKPGDDLVINGFTAVVMDVVDATHLTIKAWPYAAQTAQPYAIVWRSPLRYVGGQAMHDVDSLIQYLTGGVFPTISGGTASSSTLTIQSTSGAGATDAIFFKTGSQVTRLQIDSPGTVSVLGGTLKLEHFGAANTLSVNQWSNDAAAINIANLKSRGTSIGLHVPVQNGDALGNLEYYGSDGVNFIIGGGMAAFVDGAVTTNHVPMYIHWATASPTLVARETMKLTGSGSLLVGTGMSDPGVAGAIFVPTSGGFGFATTKVIDDVSGYTGIWSPDRVTSISLGPTADKTIYFKADGHQFQSLASAVLMSVLSTGSILLGSGAALATSAINGFPYIGCGAGAPTGVPVGQGAGLKAMYYDTTNNKLWIYNGSWRGVVLT